MDKLARPRQQTSGGAGKRRSHLRETGDGGARHRDTFGEELRSARLRSGEELAAIAQKLRIGKPYLSAIEEGRFNDLPGTAYAIGFVRAYARHLGLDPARCIEEIRSSVRALPELAPTTVPLHSGKGRLPSAWALMTVLVTAVVIYGGYQLVRTSRTPPLPPVTAVPTQIVAQVSPHARAAAKSVGLANAPKLAAPSVPGKQLTVADAVKARSQDSATALPPGQIFGARNAHSKVVLQALATAHILVKGPKGKVYLNRMLHPGDTYRVPDLVGLSLTTPDAGAVALQLEGQNMGQAGPSGATANALSLDPGAIVNRAKRPG